MPRSKSKQNKLDVSSASTRIVKIGTPIRNAKVIALKVYSNFGYVAESWYAEK